MIKTSLTLAAIAFTLALTPAVAQGPARVSKYSCTEGDMTRLETMGGKMTDASKKAAAMKHVASLREHMARNDMAGCKTLLDDTENYFPDTAE